MLRRSTRVNRSETEDCKGTTSKYFRPASPLKQTRVLSMNDLSESETKPVPDRSPISSSIELKRRPVTPPVTQRKRIKLEESPSPLRDHLVSSPLTDLEDAAFLLPAASSSGFHSVKIETASTSQNASKSKKPSIKLRLEKPHPAPARWEQQYTLIERMRAKIVAPVDTL